MNGLRGGDGKGPVLLVDDHPVVSTALAVSLRGAGIEALRIPVTNTDGVVSEIRKYTPGLLLLDLDLGDSLDGPAPNGLQLIKPVRDMQWPVLVLSALTDDRVLANAVALGALGWISKGQPFDELCTAVHRALDGDQILSDEDRARMISLHHRERRRQAVLSDKLAKLTGREYQVLGQLSKGHSPAEIASGTGVSIATVRAHVRAILNKMEVRSQLAAVALYHEAHNRRGA